MTEKEQLEQELEGLYQAQQQEARANPYGLRTGYDGIGKRIYEVLSRLSTIAHHAGQSPEGEK